MNTEEKEILHDIAIDLRMSYGKNDWTYVLTSIGRLYDMINKDSDETEVQDNVE